MYKKDLIKAIATKTGLTLKEVELFFNAMVESIFENLKSGESITITGFGTFKAVDVKERTGRNPQTGKEIKIKAHKKIKFVPGKELKDSLN